MALFKKRSNPTPSLQKQHPYTDLPLVLASGMGRSGTTLLRQCLNAHPAINCFNHEANYIYDLFRSAKLNLGFEMHDRFLPVSLKSYWHLHQQMVLNLFWGAEQISVSDSSKAIGTYSMLDKHAANGLNWSFPRLVICNIIRNGIEVVSSYISHPPFKHMTFTEVCRLWRLRNDMFKYCERHEHAFLFRHEWLLQGNRFVDQLAKALGSVGLTYDSKCERPLRKFSRASRFEGEPETAKRNLSHRKERWKYWSNQQLDEFEKICGPTMEYQGYEIPWT